MKKRTGLLLLLLAFFAGAALAHQPVLVGPELITIEQPEISRAYYGELNGKPRRFLIKAPKPFVLYVNLLVPDQANPTGRYSAFVYRLIYNRKILQTALLAEAADWQRFYEPFGGDYYRRGPAYKQSVPAGGYEIEVYNRDNRGKYVLVVGEAEFWGPREILNVYWLVPKLKVDYFNSNLLSFLITPFGLVLVVIAGLVIRAVLQRW
ncbi:MAG: hypothetical protein MUC35_07110 [Candidatus Margulisbacteria bacterium]|jgi:hypothetical protein|nr:hypothetical protein [Candidatus Margulisiibacteriota bacterium]